MNYASGEKVRVGDSVCINTQYQGIVVAVIDDGQYSKEYTEEQWSYLKSGLIIDTDFGGIVHYQESDILDEQMELKNE